MRHWTYSEKTITYAWFCILYCGCGADSGAISLALAGGLHLVGFAVCCVGSDGWVYGWLRGFLNSIVRVMQGLL